MLNGIRIEHTGLDFSVFSSYTNRYIGTGYESYTAALKAARDYVRRMTL